MTPEEQAQMQAAQQKQDAVEQMQMQTAQAQLEKLQADTNKAGADASKAVAEAQKATKSIDLLAAQIEHTNATSLQTTVTAFYEALQAAGIISTVPGVTPPADAILAAAGFKDQGGEDPNIPEPSGVLPAMVPQSAHGDYVGGIPDAQQADGVSSGIETTNLGPGQ